MSALSGYLLNSKLGLPDDGVVSNLRFQNMIRQIKSYTNLSNVNLVLLKSIL